MNIQRSGWRSFAACGAVIASLALAACSSSSSSSSSAAATSAPPATTAAATTEPAATTPAATTPAATTSAPAADAATQVKANWTAFFDPKTPTATKATLVQGGTTTLAPVLAAQATNAQAKLTSANVTAVKVSGSTATVTWDLLLSGTPVLTKQMGTAVLEGGTWKVSKASFCGLLKLQPPVPAACA
jgi:hypothetical protein